MWLGRRHIAMFVLTAVLSVTAGFAVVANIQSAQRRPDYVRRTRIEIDTVHQLGLDLNSPAHTLDGPRLRIEQLQHVELACNDIERIMASAEDLNPGIDAFMFHNCMSIIFGEQ